ncbi:MAG TPA: OmpH family outer membrane protein [Gammaproteobacteria bacterium]|nr:OmpH family outer membrane protein [Gammaproteobacteria bacterium]
MTTKSLSLAVVLALAGVAQASAADLKIGVIDMGVLLQKSPQAQNATAEMTKKFDARRKDLMAEQDEIKTLQDDLTKNGATMSASQAQDEQSRLDEKQRDFSRKSSDYQDDYSMERNSQLSKLQQDVLKATQEFAQAQKYNLILAEGVIYKDGAVDVTDQVLAQMQKDYKTSAGSAKGGG